MSGVSPYFRRSANTMESTSNKVCRQYTTRRSQIIEYEESCTAQDEKSDNTRQKTNSRKSSKETEEKQNIEIVHNDVKIKQEVEDESYNAKPVVDHPDVKHEKYIKKEMKDEKYADEWVPKDWQILLSNIKEMRKYRTAVVDNLGCARLSDVNEPPHIKRFQTFTSLLLSAQTKDQVTAAAVGRLKEHGLTVPNIAKMAESKIGEIIKPVGFWQRKSQYLKKCTIIFQEKYDCDIPNNLKELLALPGFGPKMAHICMHSAWGQMVGIGVDTHVHRISNRLGWVRKPTKTAEDTRKELESWLPRAEWDEVNILLVGFGQETCRPVGPYCEFCLNKDICPSAFKDQAARKLKREQMKADSSPTKLKGQRRTKNEVKLKQEKEITKKVKKEK